MRSAALAAASRTVGRSMSADRPSCQVTTAMRASDATFTPSRKPPAMAERRRRGTSGPLAATKRKPGKKMPTVATSAPTDPARRNFRQVAPADWLPRISRR
jgi:hypothetical protein